MNLLPSRRFLCIPYNRAPCHFMQSHIRKVYVCLAVTCHLHFWRNDRDLLRATAVTQGWNGYRNKSQRRKLTLEKKILPLLLQRFEPATFRSRVRRSNHWAIPAPVHTSGMFLAYLPWGMEYCETDFRLNGGRPVNKTAPVAVLWKQFIWTYVHFCKRLLNFWTWVYSIPWRHPLMQVFIKHSLWLFQSPWYIWW